MSLKETMQAAPQQYLDAINNQDLEAIVALYADNAIVEDPVGSEIKSGIDEVREFYKTVVEFDLTAELTGQVRIAGNEVAFPFQVENKMEGTTMITSIIDVFKFNDEGKIVSMRAYWGEENATFA